MDPEKKEETVARKGQEYLNFSVGEKTAHGFFILIDGLDQREAGRENEESSL